MVAHDTAEEASGRGFTRDRDIVRQPLHGVVAKQDRLGSGPKCPCRFISCPQTPCDSRAKEALDILQQLLEDTTALTGTLVTAACYAEVEQAGLRGVLRVFMAFDMPRPSCRPRSG
jgi:hypothetical protein